jgi:hypothetical protein
VARLASPIGDLAEQDAHLYLWTTNGFLRDAYEVVEAWGFKPSTLLTWCKAPMGIGLGGAYTITTEFVIYARRGKLAPLRAGTRRGSPSSARTTTTARRPTPPSPRASSMSSSRSAPARTWRCSPAGPASAGTTGATRAPSARRRLDRDHCHRSLRDRGLLCQACNRALTPTVTREWMLAAISYLDRFEERAA